MYAEVNYGQFFAFVGKGWKKRKHAFFYSTKE